MYLRNLLLCDYRNINKIEIEPDPEFNVIWGDNAQGKTNFLEAIYLLGNLRSFRTNRNEELINHEAKKSNIRGDVTCQGVRRRIQLVIESTGKSARVDNKEVKRAGQFLGYLRPILFSPEEVGLIKGIPAGRRSLLDRALFQADPGFLERAQQFERCLRQRNRLLKEDKSEAEIDPWTEHLILTGARLRADRLRFVQRLQPLLRQTYRQISGGREEADIRYPAEATDEATLAQSLRRDLNRQRDRERFLRQTLAGPHRDDPHFLVEGRPLRLFGSQGQQRSFMLAFKTAQIIDLEQQIGEPPVLLLDDMTSELDRRRQGFFFRFLLERRGQVFITTTDIRPLQQEGISNARFLRVARGKIEEDIRK